MVLNHVYFLYFRSWRTLSSKLNQLGDILHVCKRGKHRRMAEKNISCWPSLCSAGHLGRQKAIQGRRPLWPAYNPTPPAFMAGVNQGCRPLAGLDPALGRPSFIRIPSFSFAYIWVLGRFVRDP